MATIEMFEIVCFICQHKGPDVVRILFTDGMRQPVCDDCRKTYYRVVTPLVKQPGNEGTPGEQEDG